VKYRGTKYLVTELETISEKRRNAHSRFIALQSKVYAGFLAMERAAYSDGALPKKHKELIAVGISVVKNCESCVKGNRLTSGARPDCF
jgi:alkylhydroperoxidase/carboxymuconolactone decarboxylase family protein YurZ